MAGRYPQNTVFVSKDALENDDPYALIYSNIEVVNAQLSSFFTDEEIAADALRSYYVDYLVTQLSNGGFSQFVYNSRWEKCVDFVTEGLAAMGAKQHLDLFEKASRQMSERLGEEGLEKFLASDYFDENPERDVLDEFNDAFLALEDSEDLTALNAAWLRSLPNLRAAEEAQIIEELTVRAEAIPDMEERMAAAQASEPRYVKLIRALCAAAGQELEGVTAGDPSYEHEGQSFVAWHFITDQGHYYMVDLDDKALMFEGESEEVVHEIEAGAEFGSD